MYIFKTLFSKIGGSEAMISVFDKKEECCGCTACKYICPTRAINMVFDEEGFLYPKINQELCIDCGKCKKVCPFQNTTNIEDKLDEPLIYAVIQKDPEIRMQSSSGGAYTAISDPILEKDGLVYGVKFDENFNVVHSRAVNAEERNEFRGSKYVQSELNDTFTHIYDDLNSGKSVLFTGTGCQTAGLRNFLANKKANTEKLIINDFVCHGTPSPLLWSNYIKFIQKKGQLNSYTFRYKVKGWHGYNIKAEYKNGDIKINSLKLKVFTNLFSSNLVLRPSCYNCKFANLNRPSDIMIGDYWGIEKVMPEIDDNKGVSLVLVNTDKGKAIFSEIRENLEVWQSNTEDCLQQNLLKPTGRPQMREQFWKDYNNNGFEYIAKKYAGYNIKGMTKKNIKTILVRTGLFRLIKR